MAVHTGGALARAVDVIPGLAILDILQVAITLVYRHHAGAGAHIDAGEVVSGNGKVAGYRYYLACLFWRLHMGALTTPICRLILVVIPLNSLITLGIILARFQQFTQAYHR